MIGYYTIPLYIWSEAFFSNIFVLWYVVVVDDEDDDDQDDDDDDDDDDDGRLKGILFL